MKLRNKKTGEIKSIVEVVIDNLKKNGSTLNAISIDEIKEEWEDYEEPKGYWHIRDDGSGVGFSPLNDSTVAHRRSIIGNYFETEEEAELAVRKLKAWKRLKDKGFKFDGIAGMGNEIYFKANEQFTHIMVDEYTADKREKEYIDDLMLLFGGEDEPTN